MGARKILIIEDEIIIAEDMKSSLEELGYDVVGHAMSYKEFVDSVDKLEFDIALVDIMLGGAKSGIDVAKFIKEKLKKPFIFVTSYSDKHTLEDAKALRPNGYIVKPFNKDDLYAAIEIVPEQSKEMVSSEEEGLINALDKTVFVKDKDLLHKIEIANISWVKSDGNYLEIYNDKNKRFLLRSSLDSFLASMPGYIFRTHRSYAVNAKFIDAVNSSYIVLNQARVPVSKTYRSKLLEYLNIM